MTAVIKGTGERRMDGERISLRLEPEDLVLLDKFVEKHPEYSNRSQFARIAIRAFIEREESVETEGSTEKKKINVITVELPRLAHETILESVRAGVYNSTEEAVVQCVRERYILTDHTLEAIKKRKLEAIRETVEVMPER